MTIATVRPPTMLADVAVAVHPDDERYRDLVGKEVIVPFAERRVPIIADERVDPEFGTGAVKITPGHDPMDWEIGRDHELPEPMVIGLDGRMNEEAGELAGLTQAEAEERILAQLEERGLIEKRESFRHSVGHCDRSGDRIEPLVLLQWWVEMEELVEAGDRRAARGPRALAARAADEGDALLPREHPAVVHLAAALVGAPDPRLVLRATGTRRSPRPSRRRARVRDGASSTQEEDVLDTWFSSALWPFATLGWPERDAGPRDVLPGRRLLDRPRHQLPLGLADDLGRARADGRRPVPRRQLPRDDPRARTGGGCRRASAPGSTRLT